MSDEMRPSESRASSQLPELQSSQSFGSQSSNGDIGFSFNADNSQGPTPAVESGEVDKFAHTRGKRKRTSREDFGILEAEYQKNPRPDKVTRSKIVSRVSLTDKEVQIWFQNRRQMTRRKCRTWQPNEITSIIRSSQEFNNDPPSSDPSNAGDRQSSQQHEQGEQEFNEHVANAFFEPASSPEVERATRSVTAGGSSEPEINHIKTDGAAPGQTQLERPDASTHTSPDVAKDYPPEARSVQSSPQTSESHNTNKAHESQDIAGNSGPTSGRTPLKRSSSSFRLSVSLDGKAQVVMEGGTPSPPKKSQPLPMPRRSGCFQRSQSLISPGTTSLETFNDGNAWQRYRTHGRSRDARTWEFYADPDAQNSINEAAELDRQGSALGVIGLIRSGSGARKPLTPVRKENLPLKTVEGGAKRKSPGDHDGQKPKFARTTSSVARMQTATPSEKSAGKAKEGIEIWEEPSGDSDKENWEPMESDTQSTQQRPRQIRTTQARPRVLQENTTIMSHSNSLGAMMQKDPTLSARKKKLEAVHGQENQDPVVGKVAHVSSRDTSATREEDEMDAVQNLLRLSQGAWR